MVYAIYTSQKLWVSNSTVSAYNIPALPCVDVIYQYHCVSFFHMINIHTGKRNENKQ